MITDHKDKDGVQMLFTSKDSVIEYYLSDADDINDGKFITTDHNHAEKKTEGNLTFWLFITVIIQLEKQLESILKLAAA